MNQEKIEEIKAYVARTIPDIARKTESYQDDVVKVIKEALK